MTDPEVDSKMFMVAGACVAYAALDLVHRKKKDYSEKEKEAKKFLEQLKAELFTMLEDLKTSPMFLPGMLEVAHNCGEMGRSLHDIHSRTIQETH